MFALTCERIGRARAEVNGSNPLTQLLEDFIQKTIEDIALAREIEIERTPRDARAFDDVRDARVVVPFLREDLFGEEEDLITPRFLQFLMNDHPAYPRHKISTRTGDSYHMRPASVKLSLAKRDDDFGGLGGRGMNRPISGPTRKQHTSFAQGALVLGFSERGAAEPERESTRHLL